MNALRRLEQGGYRFDLADGRLTFSYHGAEPLPARWAAPLLAEVKERREEVKAILQARLDWLAVFDEWSALQPCDPATDAAYAKRLAELAVAGLLPNYEDGVHDAGAAGWRRLAASYEMPDNHVKEVMPMRAEEPRPLPWETHMLCTNPTE